MRQALHHFVISYKESHDVISPTDFFSKPSISLRHVNLEVAVFVSCASKYKKNYFQVLKSLSSVFSSSASIYKKNVFI